MAERGAHLTGTIFRKPSIFEIVAQDSLASIVEPAFKKIFSFLVSCNIERYGHLFQWSDEAYLICNTVLQRYYMNKYSASFAETFYGLKRIALTNTGFKQTLSSKQKTLCVMLLVTLPYVKSKLNGLSQRYRLQEADGIAPQNKWLQFVQVCLTKGYATLLIVYEVVALYRYILYISGKSSYPTPIFKLLSLTLTYAAPQPILSTTEILRKLKHNSFQFVDSLILFERLLTRSIELGAFLLQFLSWQNQESYYPSLMALPVPPSPKVMGPAKRYKGICPVCCNKPYISTGLTVSGYVFCYQCILPVIRKTNKCPVTNYPASEDDLIRLYVD